MKHKKIISGKRCSLRLLEIVNEKYVDLFHELFNEQEIYDFLNHEYTANNTKPKIRKWIKSKIGNPCEVWYIIRAGLKPAGYICFKWRKHYDEACEISTAIAKNFRGNLIGYESSKLLLEYIKGLKKFKFIAGYYYITNKIAERNLRKLGFKKADNLHKIITKEFYGNSDAGSGDIIYHLMVIKQK